MHRISFFLMVQSLFCILSMPAFSITNGGFEVAGTPDDGFTPPDGWDYQNYAGLHSSFAPENDFWSISAPYEGNLFVLLSNGAYGSFGDGDIQFAQLSQRCTFNSGETLSFSWFFGTYDYPQFEDFATAVLAPTAKNTYLAEIPLVSIEVSDVGAQGSTGDWQTVTFTFDNITAGEYDLIFNVQDYQDTIYTSFFAVDAITVTPEPTTIALLGLGAFALVRKRH